MLLQYLFGPRLSKTDRVLFSTGLTFLLLLLLAAAFCSLYGARAGVPRTPVVVVAKACNDASQCLLDVLLLTGQVLPETDKDVIRKIELLRKQTGLNTVCFNSPGGDNLAATQISRYISKSAMDTCMAPSYQTPNSASPQKAECHSMCPWMLQAGRHRLVLGNSVIVGFHGSATTRTFCGCAWQDGANPQARHELAELIRSNSLDRGDSKEVLQKHLTLLDWSFEQGIGATVAPPVKKLLAEYAFFTSDIR